MDGARDGQETIRLIIEAKAGSHEALDALLSGCRRRLESLVFLRMGPRLCQRVEVEDVLQETSLMAFRSIGQFEWKGDGAFFHWLRGIAEHVIQNLVRHHFGTGKRDGRREVSLVRPEAGEADQAGEVGIDLPGRDPTPSDLLRRHERFDRLERALAGLSPDHRQVIILARLEGLPMKEIARRMDRSIDAASMLLLRALRQLRSRFGSTDSIHLPDRSMNLPPPR